MKLGWRVIVVIVALWTGFPPVATAQEPPAGTPQETSPGTPQRMPPGSIRQGGPPRSPGGPTQGFGFKWWQDARFKTELGLSADQCKRAEDAYQGVRPRMTGDMEELSRLERRLSEVITAGVLPETDVVKLIEQVETARAQLGTIRTLLTYRLRQILTSDQRIKIKAMHDAWEKERRQGAVRKRPQGMPREGGLL